MVKKKNEVNDIKEKIDDVLKDKKDAYVLFYASWCPFSQAFLPIYNKYCEKQPDKFFRVMVDDDDPILDRFSVEHFPTVICFENGKVKKRCDAEAGIGLNEKKLLGIIDSE